MINIHPREAKINRRDAVSDLERRRITKSKREANLRCDRQNEKGEEVRARGGICKEEGERQKNAVAEMHLFYSGVRKFN